MHTIPLINHPCTVCCNPTSMWCSRCQSAWYCSPEHLKADWGRHRNECVPASNATPVTTYNLSMIATPPPAELQTIRVSAILFAAEEERPRTVVIECRPSPKMSQGICPTPLLQKYFPEGTAESLILTRGLNGENLRFPLSIWYNSSALKRGSPVNRSICHITSNAATKPWCGTVVVLKYNGSRRQGYADASSNDFPALSAYFLAYK
ncbi:hypothetical protein CC2G_011463 [Coprinopsis cinerea AmutBmut pab1-1]|nr:hypothetical protein CC2G_011463 [Coprinopsis cinerea AmutBmut pab1-1]